MDLMNALAQAGGVEAISRELGVDQATMVKLIDKLEDALQDSKGPGPKKD